MSVDFGCTLVRDLSELNLTNKQGDLLSSYMKEL